MLSVLELNTFSVPHSNGAGEHEIGGKPVGLGEDRQKTEQFAWILQWQRSETLKTEIYALWALLHLEDPKFLSSFNKSLYL